MDTYFSTFKKYAEFNGRANRSEFWTFFFINFAISIVLGIISPGLQLLFALVILLPQIAVGVRRLHDINKNGAWYLLIFIPIIGAIILLVHFLQPGTIGRNEFGDEPNTNYPSPKPDYTERKPLPNPQTKPWPIDTEPKPKPTPQPKPMVPEPQAENYHHEEELKTLKVSYSSPKTLKFIPGKFTIVKGEDAGKSFKISGYPTSEGSIVSIGRDEIKGDRVYSHIQLFQRTISRKHAEIIHREGKLLLKNLSEINPIQINGYEMKVGELTELKPGSLMQFGELEIKYES